MANRSKAGTTRPDDVPDEVWAEAVRHAAVVAPLTRKDCLTRARVRDAARELGLSLPSAYRLTGAVQPARAGGWSRVLV